MLTVHIEMDGRTLGGNEMLIPFAYAWLGGNSCKQLLPHVLAHNHQRHDFLTCDSGGSKIVVQEAPRDH